MEKPDLEEFCLVDQWAAEAYLTALDAPEPTMLEMLNKGVKIHDWMWEVTKAKWPDALPSSSSSSSGYNYKRAKQTVHALNYGVREAKMAAESGLDLQICEWQHHYYHTCFPRIKLRQERIRQEIKETRTLTSVLGRKCAFIAPWSDELFQQAFAWPSQSVIGELTNIAITKLMLWGQVKRDPWMFPSLNTHDGSAIRVPVGCREAVTLRVRDAFNIPLSKHGLTITIPVEIGFGPNFNDVDKSTVRIIRYEAK